MRRQEWVRNALGWAMVTFIGVPRLMEWEIRAWFWLARRFGHRQGEVRCGFCLKRMREGDRFCCPAFEEVFTRIEKEWDERARRRAARDWPWPPYSG